MIDLTDDSITLTSPPPADLASWMAERTAAFEAEFAAARAKWNQPRPLRIIDGGGA